MPTVKYSIQIKLNSTFIAHIFNLYTLKVLYSGYECPSLALLIENMSEVPTALRDLSSLL